VSKIIQKGKAMEVEAKVVQNKGNKDLVTIEKIRVKAKWGKKEVEVIQKGIKRTPLAQTIANIARDERTKKVKGRGRCIACKKVATCKR